MGIRVSKLHTFCPCPCTAQPVADRDLPTIEVAEPENGGFAVRALVRGGEGEILGRVRFICVSDTHGFHRKLKLSDDPDIVFLHCGDFSGGKSKGGDQAPGGLEGIRDFNDWLGSLPYRHKIVVGGNHELALPEVPGAAAKLLSNATDYLFCSGVSIPGPNSTSVAVWGAPHRPKRGSCYKKNKFEVSAKAREDAYTQMPAEAHVVVTHGPPFGVRDLEAPGHIGDEIMLDAVYRAKPLVHCFGHVHPHRGASRMWHGGKSEGGSSTLFLNAASIGNPEARAHGGVAPPMVFDVELVGSGHGQSHGPGASHVQIHGQSHGGPGNKYDV